MPTPQPVSPERRVDPHLVLFDVDGTLVDSQHMIVTAMTRAFAAHGLAAPGRDAVLGIVGLSIAEAIRALAPAEAPHAGLADAYKNAFHALRMAPDHHEPLFPGAAACLDALSARPDVLLGVATGKSKRGVAAIVDLHGLHGRFVTVQTADDHPSKPHPSMVMRALAETGVPATRTVIVGDSSYDMLMARAAGILAIGVGWGYQDPAALRNAGAHAVVETYEEVAPTIARLFGW
jgi:phosphoglycolate phosphatase